VEGQDWKLGWRLEPMAGRLWRLQRPKSSDSLRADDQGGLNEGSSFFAKVVGRLAKLEQVGCFGDGAVRLVVANAPKTADRLIDPARGAEGMVG
jgi:hypothetical protein